MVVASIQTMNLDVRGINEELQTLQQKWDPEPEMEVVSDADTEIYEPPHYENEPIPFCEDCQRVNERRMQNRNLTAKEQQIIEERVQLVYNQALDQIDLGRQFDEEDEDEKARDFNNRINNRYLNMEFESSSESEPDSDTETQSDKGFMS